MKCRCSRNSAKPSKVRFPRKRPRSKSKDFDVKRPWWLVSRIQPDPLETGTVVSSWILRGDGRPRPSGEALAPSKLHNRPQRNPRRTLRNPRLPILNPGRPSNIEVNPRRVFHELLQDHRSRNRPTIPPPRINNVRDIGTDQFTIFFIQRQPPHLLTLGRLRFQEALVKSVIVAEDASVDLTQSHND